MINNNDIEAELRSLKKWKEDGLINDEIYHQRLNALLNSRFVAKPADTATPPRAGTDTNLNQANMNIGSQDRSFKLLEQISEGAMGKVWKALDIEATERYGKDKYVALKLMQDMVNDAKAEKRLKAEADKAKQLSHPNIVKVWGWHKDPLTAVPFIEMEYLQGQDIQSHLQAQCNQLNQTQATLQQALSLLSPIAQALKHAWENSELVHRDIKPDNIIITQDGTPKLLDFGIAVNTRTNSAINIDATGGTRGYHAPEAAVNHKISPKLDTYSMASLLYELLEGNVPFDATRSPHTPWPEQPAQLTPTQWQILQQALVFDAKARTETSWDLIKQLDAEIKAEQVAEVQKLLAGKEADIQLLKTKLVASENASQPTATITINTQTSHALINPTPLSRSYSEVKDCPAFDMVQLPRGSFTMGNDYGLSNEKPAHLVTIDYDFEIGQYLVTKEQWIALMGRDVLDYLWKPCLKCPVDGVSLDLIYNVFISKLNDLTEKEYRLPSEAEWEYACRAGTGYLYSYSGGNNIDEVAWYDKNSNNTTHPVGEKKPNAWGIYDMNGNVWEWVLDNYVDNYQNAPDNGHQPVHFSSLITKFVLRGGAYYSNSKEVRPESRSSGFGRDLMGGVGFRLARTMP